MQQIVDTLRGLVNTMTGLGGARDKGAAGSWHFTQLDRQQIESAYRSNWMIRKAVDIPVFDMLRQGWQWQGDKDVISELEAAESQLSVVQRLSEAMTFGRLFGGGAIILSDGGDPAQPLVSGKDKLKFLVAVSRYELSSIEIDNDPLSPSYGEPLMYSMVSAAGGSVNVHPSRVVRFLGAQIPMVASTVTADRWSDSVVETINEAVRDAAATQRGIAHLVQEASVDVWRVDGLMNNVSNAEYRKAMTDRMSLVQQMKGMVHATVMDKDDEYNQKTANFSQLPDILTRLLQVVSGAADIPATRFLGQSPAGMNATGDADLRNYYDRLKAEQNLRLRPPLQKLMNALVPSVLGSYPADLWFDFPSLWQMSEKERAEVGKMNAESADIVMRNGLVPGQVMQQAVTNQMIESGNWPGLETAYEDWEATNKAEFDLGGDDDEGDE